MFSKKKSPPIRSLIAHGSVIEGRVTFIEGMRVDGEVMGDVHAAESPQAGQASLLVISETGKVQGAIKADYIVINGTVTGPIHARELLELQPKARVEGDVNYAALEMHQGALVTGRMSPVVMVEEKPLLKLASNSKSA